NYGVKRALARRVAIWMTLVQNKARPAILQHDAGVARDDSGSKSFEQAVDERDRVMVLIDDGEVGRVAVVQNRSGDRLLNRLVEIDELSPRRGVPLREQFRHGNF